MPSMLAAWMLAMVGNEVPKWYAKAGEVNGALWRSYSDATTMNGLLEALHAESWDLSAAIFISDTELHIPVEECDYDDAQIIFVFRYCCASQLGGEISSHEV